MEQESTGNVSPYFGEDELESLIDVDTSQGFNFDDLGNLNSFPFIPPIPPEPVRAPPDILSKMQPQFDGSVFGKDLQAKPPPQKKESLPTTLPWALRTGEIPEKTAESAQEAVNRSLYWKVHELHPLIRGLTRMQFSQQSLHEAEYSASDLRTSGVHLDLEPPSRDEEHWEYDMPEMLVSQDEQADFLRWSEQHLNDLEAMTHERMLRVSSGSHNLDPLDMASVQQTFPGFQMPYVRPRLLSVPQGLRLWHVAEMGPQVSWAQSMPLSPAQAPRTLVAAIEVQDGLVELGIWRLTPELQLEWVARLGPRMVAEDIKAIVPHPSLELLAMITPMTCACFSSTDASLTTSVEFPKHDLCGGCWVGNANNPVFLLLGAHVRSKEGKLASWRPSEGPELSTLFEFKGTHVVQIRAAPMRLSEFADLVLLRHSDSQITVGLWIVLGEAEEDCFVVLAHLRIPESVLSSASSEPDAHFSNSLDVVVCTGTHVLSYLLPDILQPEELSTIISRPPKKVLPQYAMPYSTHANMAYPSSSFCASLRGEEYAFVIVGKGALGMVNVEEGSIMEMALGLGEETILGVECVFHCPETEALFFALKGSEGIILWRFLARDSLEDEKEDNEKE